MNEPEKTESGPFPLNQLYVYLTGTCDLHCRHCWIEPRSAGAQADAHLDPVLLISILDEARPLGLTAVKLTGGEPLLHPEIFRVLDLIRERNLSLTLETNGTHCSEALAAHLAGFPEASVSVSLDGADAKTHDAVRGKAGCFAQALAGIGRLVRRGVRPQIIMTVMKRNRDQLPDLVGLAERLGAGSVKFNVLQPTARGKRLHESGEALDMGELIRLGKWIDLDLAARSSLPLIFHQPPAFQGLGALFRENGQGCHCCGILGILGVLADGSYALCGIGATVPELVFGHAGTDRLEDIWRNHPVLNQIRAGLPGRLSGVCSRCVMSRICLGSCIAQNYYRSGDLWAPFWYCDTALREGLFPQTRLRPEGARPAFSSQPGEKHPARRPDESSSLF